MTFKFEEIEKLLESANLNFLIGSGASKPFLETLQDIEKVMDAFDKNKNKSFSDDYKENLKREGLVFNDNQTD